MKPLFEFASASFLFPVLSLPVFVVCQLPVGAFVSVLSSAETPALFGTEDDSDSFSTWKSVLELSPPASVDRFWR